MREKILCPVKDCGGELDTTPPDVPDGALADGVGGGVVAATQRAQALRDNERKMEQHLKGHTVLEWMNTVSALRDLLASQIAQTVEIANALGGATKQ